MATTAKQAPTKGSVKTSGTQTGKTGKMENSEFHKFFVDVDKPGYIDPL
jgi:hypothetical protein